MSVVLREAGKVSRPELEKFLEMHAAKMPRTTLRYAIERFSPEDRKMWLKIGKPPKTQKGIYRNGMSTSA